MYNIHIPIKHRHQVHPTLNSLIASSTSFSAAKGDNRILLNDSDNRTSASNWRTVMGMLERFSVAISYKYMISLEL